MAGASASWRAPWLDTTTAAAPASTQRTASSARCTPLTTTGSVAQPGQPPDVVGRERRLELVRHDGHEPTLARAVGAVAGQVGQGQVVGQVHADAPLAQAEPRDGGVDGQDQGAVAVGGGAADQLLGARPLPQYVDLHPAGGVGRRGGHVLERAGGERGQDQQRAHRGGAPGGGHLALGVGQPLNGRRGDGDGRADRGAEQGGGGGHLGRSRPGRGGGAASGSRPPRCPAAGARRRHRPSSRRRRGWNRLQLRNL